MQMWKIGKLSQKKPKDNKTTRQQTCLEDSTERSESNPGRSLGTYKQKETSVWKTVPFPIGIFLLFLSIDIFFVHLCLEDSTFQHSEKESIDKNKAQKVMLCKSIAFTLQ